MGLQDFLREILYVVVVYKTDPAVAIAKLDWVSEANSSVFIFDNSPEASTVDGAIYKHDPSNPGVSRAYNEAYKTATESGKKWMLLLDQDTALTAEYMGEVYNSVKTNSEMVAFVPTLVDKRGIVSPFRWNPPKGKRIETVPSRCSLREYRFANTGLLILCDAFSRAGGYDEKIPLDFSDIEFGERLSRVSNDFCAVPKTLTTDFSGSENQSPQQAIHRFNYYLKGSRYMGAIMNLPLRFRFESLMRALKLTVTYKSIYFLRVFLKHSQSV
jgi:rhamnosyltransferase